MNSAVSTTKPAVPPPQPHIAALAAYIPGEQPPPGVAIKLNTNESPYPPSPTVAAAVQTALAGGLQRYPDPLATAFRRAAADVLQVDVDQILCGNGSDDILTILTRTYLGPGDLLRFPNPSYILYRTLAAIQSARSEELPFAEDWSLSEEFFEQPHDLRLVYIPNPNSPTGTLVPKEQIVRLASTLTCPVVVDEAYVDFAESSCVDLPIELPNVIVTRTLSKSYALAGLRFGYCVAHPQVIATLRKVKDSYNTDALANAAATAAIADQAWLAENVRRCNATRERMTKQLQQLGFACIPSQANFVWAVHPNVDSRAIYQQLKDRDIYVRYMSYAGWQSGLRISVGTDAQIDRLLEEIRVIVEATHAGGR